jgi:hypothetical protein
MRSVTFADDKVVDTLNAGFVLVWNNHAPDYGGGGDGARQPLFSKEEIERYPEGAGGGNIRSYVCRDDGSIAHYVEGWYRPARYLAEISFAVDLLGEGDASAKRKAHRDALVEAQAKIAREQSGEMQKPFEESAARREHAMLGLLVNVQDLARQAGRQKIEKLLEQIKESYSERGVIK